MLDLMSVLEFCRLFDSDSYHLWEDRERAREQEESILDQSVQHFGCPSGVDELGHRTYPINLLKLHFGIVGDQVWWKNHVELVRRL